MSRHVSLSRVLSTTAAPIALAGLLSTPAAGADPGSAPVIPRPGIVSLALPDVRAAFTDAVCSGMVMPDTGPFLVVTEPPTMSQRLHAAIASGEVYVDRDGPQWGLDLRSWVEGRPAQGKANSRACQGPHR